MRDAVGPKGKGFAIQDECVSRNALRLFDHFRNRCRDIVQRAREDAHIVSQFMELHPRAIHFVLKCGSAEFAQRIRDILDGLGQHRLDRLEQLQRKRF